jgi:hypothetical protein
VSLQRRLGSILGLAGLGFVLLATLTPASDPLGLALTTPRLCLVCGEQGGADVAVNLLMFLPLAIGLRLQGASWKRTVLICFLLSCTVELLQLRLVPGRYGSISDVITNTSSAAIGATVGAALPRWVAPRPNLALALVAAGVALLLGLLGLWSWLLMPSVPEGRLISRWAHESPGIDVFDGRVRAVRLDGLPMPPDGPPPDSATLRRRLDAGEFRLEADVISGRPVSGRFWIYMFRVPSVGALTLNQLRREVGVAVPSRGLRYKLHPVLLTLADGFPDSAGVAVHLTASESSRWIRLASRYAGRERSLEMGLSPAFGWILFVPFQLAVGTGVRWVTGTLLFLLLLPLGYWGAWCRPRRWALGLGATGILLALGLLPAAAGFPPVHWSEWLGAAAGAAGGWALQPVAAYLQRRCASRSASESF